MSAIDTRAHAAKLAAAALEQDEATEQVIGSMVRGLVAQESGAMALPEDPVAEHALLAAILTGDLTLVSCDKVHPKDFRDRDSQYIAAVAVEMRYVAPHHSADVTKLTARAFEHRGQASRARRVRYLVATAPDMPTAIAFRRVREFAQLRRVAQKIDLAASLTRTEPVNRERIAKLLRDALTLLAVEANK